MTAKGVLSLLLTLLLPAPWLVAWAIGWHPEDPAVQSLLTGLAIFGSAFLLSWAAELSELEIPKSLAISALALIAVLPEYAVDMAFAWKAGKEDKAIAMGKTLEKEEPDAHGHSDGRPAREMALANMTGANRLLIGLGWASVVFFFFFKTRRREVRLEPAAKKDLRAMLAATGYCLILPFKGTLTIVDTAVLLILFGLYLRSLMKEPYHEPQLHGVPLELAGFRRPIRNLIMAAMFLYAAGGIFVSAHPFAEGLVATGKIWNVNEFLLVQWLAPLASESPEFIVAIRFALQMKPESGLGTLVSSKVNQWTLLVGMLPLTYVIARGEIVPMVLGGNQPAEILLTAAQSLFAVVVLASLGFNLFEASLIATLFLAQLMTQVLFQGSMPEYAVIAIEISTILYFLLCVVWFLIRPKERDGFMKLLGTRK